MYVYFEDRDAWIQTNGAVGGGSGIDFYSGTFHGEDQSADDHVIIIPVPSNGKCGGVLELSDYATNSNQDEGGMLSWNFDATTGEIKMQQCWSGGNSTYLKSNSVTATLTNTYQSIDISMPYQLVAWEARYLDGSLYLSSDAHIGVWQATVSSGGGGASGGGGGTPAGASREIQFNDNGAFGSNENFLFDEPTGTAFIPRLVVGEGAIAGDEGGEMVLKQSVTNNTLQGNWVYMDIWQNRIRFFEDGLPYKGAYIDLSECADGVGTNLLAGGGGGGGSYGTSAIDAAADQFFYSDAGHTTGINLTNATDGARFYNKDKFILVHLVYSASSNQSATLDVTYYPPGSSTGYIVGATRKGGGSGHAYQQNITFAMAPGSSCQVDNTSFVQRAATVLLADSGAGPRAYVAFDGKDANVNSTMTNVFNVSSITDNGTGNYTVTFANSISNPVVSATIASDQTYAQNAHPKESKIAVFEKSSTSVQVRTGRGSYIAVDCPVDLLVF